MPLREHTEIRRKIGCFRRKLTWEIALACLERPLKQLASDLTQLGIGDGSGHRKKVGEIRTLLGAASRRDILISSTIDNTYPCVAPGVNAP